MSENFFDLTGQVAIVTGTSRGLGQYFARALARAGADLVLTSRKRETLADVRSRDAARWAAARVSLELDVRDHDSIQQMAQRSRSGFRADSHPREQRRLQCAQAGARRHLGRLEPDARHQSARQLLRGAGGSARHDRARLRPHHQHRLGDQRRRLCRPRRPMAPAAAASAS